MKGMLWIAVVIAWSGVSAASAASVRVASCDGRYRLDEDATGHVLLHTPAGKSLRLAPRHRLLGGAIDVVHRQFVIYGMPAVVDRAAPQAMAISAYAGLDRPRQVMRETTGTGIYNMGYTIDGRAIMVEYGYGIFMIDLARKHGGALLPPTQTPPTVASCDTASATPPA